MSEKNLEEALLPYLKLQLSVSNPPLEDCYLEGYEASNLEFSEEDNPYEPHSMESQYWLDGWWAGFYGEAPCLELFAKKDEFNVSAQAANDESFDSSDRAITNVAKVAAVVAATILGYQIIDMIA